jgi:hypothetical protein
MMISGTDISLEKRREFEVKERERERYLLTGMQERRRGLIKVLWVYLGSDMNELFTALTVPSRCLVCDVRARHFTD